MLTSKLLEDEKLIENQIDMLQSVCIKKRIKLNNIIDRAKKNRTIKLTNESDTVSKAWII